jgi:hypothetical protein
MQRFARIEAGVVVEIMTSPAGVDFASLFHPDIAAACRVCGPDVSPGWVFDGQRFLAPPPVRVTPERLLAYAADLRWRLEVGGVTVDGVPVATDDRSKIMVMGARAAALADAGWKTVWHGTDGRTYPVNAKAMIAIGKAIEAHVASTFATFAAVKAAIAAGEIATFAAIDAAFAA